MKLLRSLSLPALLVLGCSLACGAAQPGAGNPGLPGPVIERKNLAWADGGVLVAYLVGMLAVGLYFARREKTTDSFFRGGQRLPWWAVGLSIYATMLSSITFMALPAKSYATDWTYLFANLGIIAVAPIVILFYVPFYRHLNVTSAYEYLEKRLSLPVRLFASLSFMAFQIGRMAIVLYLPAIALATVTTLDVYTCILVTSVLCIIYTMIGGIEAVIWTDAVQTLVLLGGALTCLGVVFFSLPEGLGGLLARAHSNGKFLERATWLSSDFTQASVLLVFGGSLFNHLMSYTASQDVVQRYVTTRSGAHAARSILTNAALVLPGSIAFFLLGTALYLFYAQHPERLEAGIVTDQIVPYFIIHELPAGVAGLVLAAIFAASQSTLSSSLNSVSAAWMTDIVQRFRPGRDDRRNLRGAQTVVVVSGTFATLAACTIAKLKVASMFDAFIFVIGLTGGAISGLFILGIFTRRANGRGALVGAVSSIAVLLVVSSTTRIHVFLYSMIGTLTCVLVGYVVSLAFPSTAKDLQGLTWHDRPPRQGEAEVGTERPA
jgi:SSS family solute:Na+ symporter